MMSLAQGTMLLGLRGKLSLRLLGWTFSGSISIGVGAGGNTEGGKKSFNPLLTATACGSVQFCACMETTWQVSLRVRSILVLTSV